MPVTQRYYRLRIRNAADSADTLILSSEPGGDNPYIAEPPHGDGEEIDIITGDIRHGAYTVLAVDPAAPGRPITSILADASGFWQPLGRKAFIETSTDGSAWSPRTAGYVQAVRFPDAITAEFTIGDAQRIDLTREVFARATAAFPGVTALAGGPIVGGTGVFKDRGAWRMRVVDASAGPTGVGLAFVRGWIPSRVILTTGFQSFVLANSLSSFARDYINGRAHEYAVPDFARYFFPALTVQTTPAGGGSPLTHTPYARAPLFSQERNLISADNLLTVDWDGTLPSVNDEFDVYVYPSEVSPSNPMHVQGHPIDILTELWSEAGISFDTTAAASTKTALGADAWLDLRLEHGTTLGDFARSVILGPFGVAWRTGADGERELFTTRKRSTSNPSTTITTSEMLGDPKSQPILFELDESTIVDAVTYSQRRLQPWTPLLEVERPPDDIVSAEDKVTVLLDGVTAPKNEVEYAIPGQLKASPAQFDEFARASAQDLLLRFGFGCPFTELEVLESVADPLGNEIILDADHQINGNVRGGERILQVIRRTPEGQKGGVSLKVLDAGTTAQIGTAPTISLAAIGKNGVEVTVTNKATLDAAGWNVRVEWGFGGSQPSDGALLKVLTTTDDDVFDTPQVDSGARVWVRARSERADRRPSSYSSWSDVNLTDLTAPSSLVRSGNVLSWTNGESDRLTAVEELNPSSLEITGRIEVLPAGSTSFDVTPFATASTSVAFGVRHIDEPPFGGVSTMATISYTTASATALAALVAPVAVRGDILSGDRNTGLVGIEATSPDADPSTMEAEVAVETSVGSGTFGSFSLFAAVPCVVGGPTQATFIAPKDGLTRRFRARRVAPSRTASSYTSNIDVIPWSSPVRPPIPRRAIPIVNDAGGVVVDYPAGGALADGDLTANIDGDTEVQAGSLFVEDDETIEVGTIASPSARTKLLRFTPTFFVPTDEIQSYTRQGDAVYVGQAEVTVTLSGSFILPQGATITEVSARFFQNATSGTMATAQLFRNDADGSSTSLGTIGGESTSGWYTDSMVLDEDVAGNTYRFSVTLQGTSQFDSGIRWAEVEYTMPAYHVTI